MLASLSNLGQAPRPDIEHRKVFLEATFRNLKEGRLASWLGFYDESFQKIGTMFAHLDKDGSILVEFTHKLAVEDVFLPFKLSQATGLVSLLLEKLEKASPDQLAHSGAVALKDPEPRAVEQTSSGFLDSS